MKQYRNFSFIGATQGLRTHQPEANLPTARKIENFYVSRSDGALTLRPDLWRFRDDLYDIGSYLQSSTKKHFLNTVITSDTEERHALITSYAPTGIGVEITSNQYDTGTVTTDGTTSTVIGSGTAWKNVIWPGCLIEFDGSSNLYLILGVNSDTSIDVDGIPPALAGVEYTIYRCHDYTRAQYPVHVERYNNQYIYCASSPSAGEKETISGPFTSDGDFINNTTSTTTTTTNTSVVRCSVDIVRPAFNRVAYLNSEWIGTSGQFIFTSSDRMAWEQKPQSPASSGLVSYGGGYYVGVETPGGLFNNPSIRLHRSTNLESWSYVEIPLYTIASITPPANIDGEAGVVDSQGNFVGSSISINVSDIIYAGSKFVVVGSVSASGFLELTWHYASDVTTQYTQYISVSYSRPLILTSADALTWTSVDPGSAYNNESFNSVSYANSKYICAMSSSFAHSTNATSWTKVAYPSGVASISRFAFGSALYVAVGKSFSSSATIKTSPDLTTWTDRTVPATTLSVLDWYEDVLFDGTNFIAVSGRTIDQSTNGTSWTNVLDRTVDSSRHFRSAANNSSALLVSGQLLSYLSDDGTSWTYVSPDSPTFRAIASTNNAASEDGTPDTIVAVGDTTLGFAYVSDDGQHFTPAVLPDTYHKNDVIWNGSVFVAVGDYGTIVTSPDGYHWTARTSGTIANLYAITYNGTLGSEKFVAVGDVPPPSGTEDFESYVLGSAPTPNFTNAAGAWTVVSFDPPGSTPASQHLKCPTATSAERLIWWDIQGSSIEDFDLTLDWQKESTGDAQVVFRGSGVGATLNCYAVINGLDAGHTAQTYLYKFVNGTPTQLVASAKTRDHGSPTSCRILVVGTSIKVKFWDKVTETEAGTPWHIDTTDATFTIGKIGLRNDEDAYCHYDNLTLGSVVGNAAIVTSSDGVTWTVVDSGETTSDFYAVSYGNSVYVAAGENGVTYTSTDASTWTNRISSRTTVRKLFYDGSYFYMVGDDGLLQRSTNGLYDATKLNCFTEYGDTGNYLSEWKFSGATTSNTDDGLLYWNYTYTASPENFKVEVYSDSAKTTLVASGDVSAPGTITLAEQGGSGLSGTVVVDAAATTTITDSSQKVLVHWEKPQTLNYGEDFYAFWGDGTYSVMAGESALALHVINSEYDSVELDDEYYGIPGSSTISGLTRGYSYDYYYAVEGNLIFKFTNDVGGTTTVTVISQVPGEGWIPLSEIYRGACFACVDGYVIIGNINELESDVWKHYGQRIRWTSPGTYNDFAAEGSGLADLLGLGVGDIVDMRTLGHNVIVFMENGISVLSPTGQIDLPFELRVVKDRITAISNPVVVDDSVLFIATDGLLYQANSVSCQPVSSQFDISEFDDFDPSLVTQLVYDRTLNVLFCFQPYATGDHKVYVINPITWSVSYFNLPECEAQFTTNIQYPRGIVQSISVNSIPSQASLSRSSL